MENYVFKGSKIKTLCGILTVIVLTTLGIWFILNVVQPEIQKWLFIGLTLIVLLMLYRQYREAGKSIHVSKEGITACSGKKCKEYKFDKYFISSFVERSYTNGIPTGTSRYLVINDGIEKEKRIRCNIGKKSFNLLMSYVISYSKKSEQKSSGESAFDNQQAKVFHLNKKGMSGLFSIWKIIFTILVVLSVLSFFLVNFFLSGEYTYSFMFVLIPLYMMVFSIFIIFFLRIAFLKSRMPEEISIENKKMKIDETDYYYEDIALLNITPASYDTGYYSDSRTMKIKTNDGKEKKFYMGSKNEKRNKNIFEEYDEFVEILNSKFLDTPEKFQFYL